MIKMPETSHKKNNIYTHTEAGFQQITYKDQLRVCIIDNKMVFILRDDQKMICSANYIKDKSPLSGGSVDFMVFSLIPQRHELLN